VEPLRHPRVRRKTEMNSIFSCLVRGVDDDSVLSFALVGRHIQLLEQSNEADGDDRTTADEDDDVRIHESGLYDEGDGATNTAPPHDQTVLWRRPPATWLGNANTAWLLTTSAKRLASHRVKDQ
jgi:hypothetical protein